MSSLPRKKVRSLLLLFLLLYAVFTLVPAGVYGAYRLQNTSAGTSPSPEASPSPQASLPPAASPSMSPEGTGAETVPGFLESRPLPEAAPSPALADVFTLYDTATGETFQVTAEEFLPAALACEMDLSAPEEALKAQVVALYSFYSYQRAQNAGNEADFACDTANWLVYVPQSAMEERWGEDFASLYERLQNVVGSVQGQVLTWEGEPICAAFFRHFWGQYGILPAGVGAGAALSPIGSEPRGRLCPGVPLHRKPNGGGAAAGRRQRLGGGAGLFRFQWRTGCTAVSTSPSGHVGVRPSGRKTVTGEELREALGLRSACFQLRVVDEVFQFTVHGWGHGVGMSQAGAAYLASQGGELSGDLGPLTIRGPFWTGHEKGAAAGCPFFLIFDSRSRSI